MAQTHSILVRVMKTLRRQDLHGIRIGGFGRSEMRWRLLRITCDPPPLLTVRVYYTYPCMIVVILVADSATKKCPHVKSKRFVWESKTMTMTHIGVLILTLARRNCFWQDNERVELKSNEKNKTFSHLYNKLTLNTRVTFNLYQYSTKYHKSYAVPPKNSFWYNSSVITTVVIII